MGVGYFRLHHHTLPPYKRDESCRLSQSPEYGWQFCWKTRTPAQVQSEEASIRNGLGGGMRSANVHGFWGEAWQTLNRSASFVSVMRAHFWERASG